MRHAAAAPTGPRRQLIGPLLYLIVLGVAGIGLATMAQGPRHVQGGTLVLAAALLGAALARLVLPEDVAEMLRLRRRMFDVLTLATMGVGLLVAGLILPPA